MKKFWEAIKPYLLILLGLYIILVGSSGKVVRKFDLDLLLLKYVKPALLQLAAITLIIILILVLNKIRP